MLSTGYLGYLGDRGVVLTKYLARPVYQSLTGLGEDHPPRSSRKKRQPDLVLELTDLHRDRGLCDVDTTGPGRKRFSLCDGQKGFQLSDLHSLLLRFSAIRIRY